MAQAALSRSALTFETILGGSLARKAVIAVAGSLFLAAMSQVDIGWPVPMTLQTLAVMLIGVTMGFRLATATVALYIVEGALGLPVFAGFANIAVLVAKPYSAGYIAGFLVAAAVMGVMADRGLTRSWVGMIGTLLVGEAIVFALGVGFLASLIGAQNALVSGLYPFIVPDLVKLALAALLAKGVLTGAERLARG